MVGSRGTKERRSSGKCEHCLVYRLDRYFVLTQGPRWVRYSRSTMVWSGIIGVLKLDSIPSLCGK